MKTISSLQNPLVKHFVKLVDSRSYRQECGTLVIEGIKICKELLQKVELVALLTTDPLNIPEGVSIEKCTHVPLHLIEKISKTPSPEGIVAEIKIPKAQPLSSPLLILDGVSDPGNLGTLIRSAYAFNWGGVFLLPGSADPYHHKTLRASKGASLLLPIRQGTIDQLPSMTLIGADLKGMPLEKTHPKHPFALVLGSEANGLSHSMKERLTENVTIPINPDAESLNVAAAGAILMHQWRAL